MTEASWQRLAADPDAVDRELDAMASQVRALDGSLSVEQLHWQRNPQAWSIVQCVDHLAEANRLYMTTMEKATVGARPLRPGQRRIFLPGAPARWFLNQLEPPPRRRLPAPKMIVPRANPDWPATQAEFARHQASVLNLLRSTRDLDLNRVRFRNPFLPGIRWTVAVGFLVIATHERRHLWQIETLRGHPRFPSA